MCKNRYQTWSDWFNGRWTCPKCKHTIYVPRVCDDCSLATMEKGKTTYRLECVKCGFTEQLEPFDIREWIVLTAHKILIKLNLIS